MTGHVSFKEGIRANMRMDLLKLRSYRLEKVGEWYYSDSLQLNITNQEAFNQYKHQNVTLRVTTVLVRFPMCTVHKYCFLSPTSKSVCLGMFLTFSYAHK